MNKQPEVRAATKRKLENAFCTLYANKPIEKITVKEIAELAGYNRVTFYEYFRDVYDILDCVEQEVVAHILRTIRQNARMPHSSDQFVQGFLEAYSTQAKRVSLLYRQPNSTHFADTLSRAVIPAFCEFFHIAEDNLKPQYALSFYIPGIISLFGKWLDDDQAMPLEDLAKLIQGILEDGIFAQLKPE